MSTNTVMVLATKTILQLANETHTTDDSGIIDPNLTSERRKYRRRIRRERKFDASGKVLNKLLAEIFVHCLP